MDKNSFVSGNMRAMKLNGAATSMRIVDAIISKSAAAFFDTHRFYVQTMTGVTGLPWEFYQLFTRVLPCVTRLLVQLGYRGIWVYGSIP